ncbi:helix-turn-helix domain-containing protein [Sinorhizobium meliloti]|uniref:helix-turn-helix domain-containing protein n=1 Tax=Rhizobium meliloti TaxID=382 RepID=UPI00209052C3|nr:hypothetical protein [Sinorhizobium meliloti]MCO5966151.1 hypothetical protein [Sinorhizobium meliloti]
MAIETLAGLVKILVEELQRSGIEPHDLAEMTGIDQDRLALMHMGTWGYLTLPEVTAISEALEVDFFEALIRADSREG